MPNEKIKISAFGLAITSDSVGAEISIDDVLLVQPEWTRERAAQFLRRHSSVIGTRMINAGAATLVALLAGGEHGS